MRPAPEALWRHRMALMLADPDENCPGGVYYAMALRIRELETNAELWEKLIAALYVDEIGGVLDVTLSLQEVTQLRALGEITCNENDGGIGGCPVHPEGCGI